jgi:hypothetical protein
MFRASHDHGKTFGPKINLRNTPNSNSVDAQVAAEGSNRFFNPPSSMLSIELSFFPNLLYRFEYFKLFPTVSLCSSDK